MLRVVAICLALVALPALAAAEAGSSSAYCDQQQECTEYFMETDDVEGQVQDPGNDLLSSAGSFRRVPLIRTRTHFIDVMLKSVENL